MIHQLKCWARPFRATSLGLKTHEFRKNDRSFECGDILHLCLWCPATERYSGHGLACRVTYLGVGFGIPEGYVCMSIVLVPSFTQLPAIGEPS